MFAHHELNGFAATIGLLTDISTSGQAIGSSLNTGVLANVYDKDQSTRTFSSETPGTNGVSYSGQDFGAGKAYALASYSLLQGRNTGFEISECVTSIKIQHSDNGSSWTDQQTDAVTRTFTVQAFDVPGAAPHRYWRVLANSNVTAGYRWVLTEITMSAYI